MVPWCSGLAYVPVKDEIAGSNPVGTAVLMWSGFALILSAVHLLVRDFIFAFTHGTTADACT